MTGSYSLVHPFCLSSRLSLFVISNEVRDLVRVIQIRKDTAMPNKPTPQEVTVDAKTTALLVLDLNCRCEDPKEPCYKLIDPVAKFLDRSRQANMFILYTAADRYKGTPEARMPHAFKQRPDEPTIFPPAFDKFYSGEMQPMLQQRGIKTVIVCARQATRRSCTPRRQPSAPSVTPA